MLEKLGVFLFMFKKISNLHRYLILIVGVLLLFLYFTPLWTVRLEAPQYPEGLGMYISVNKIQGHEEFDLKNINLLNHYIGMEPIVEESIPELLFMPYVLAFMIAGAFFTFFYDRLIMVYLGVLNFFLLGAAGLYDFWRWEYNYGHHLNPHAPISIPGMSYQPPLAGCKQMLNITACSWPYWGGILLFLSVGILFYVIFSEYRKNAKKHEHLFKFFAAVLILVFALGCVRSNPVNIVAGEHYCEFCRMNIVDLRFKAEGISPKGKVHYFDSIECLRKWQRTHPGEVKSAWVTSYFQPSHWLDENVAFYLRSDRIHSPMGAYLAAFENEQDAKKALQEYGGEILHVSELQNTFESQKLPETSLAP